MKKSELVAAAAKRLDLSKARAGEIVDAFFGTEGIVAGELRKGNTVQISGFGSFEPRQRGARNGRDPKTGQVHLHPGVRRPGLPAGKRAQGAREPPEVGARRFGGAVTGPRSTLAMIFLFRTVRPSIPRTICSTSAAGNSTRQ